MGISHSDMIRYYPWVFHCNWGSFAFLLSNVNQACVEQNRRTRQMQVHGTTLLVPIPHLCFCFCRLTVYVLEVKAVHAAMISYSLNSPILLGSSASNLKFCLLSMVAISLTLPQLKEWWVAGELKGEILVWGEPTPVRDLNVTTIFYCNICNGKRNIGCVRKKCLPKLENKVKT